MSHQTNLPEIGTGGQPAAPPSVALVLATGLAIPCLIAYGFAVGNEYQVLGLLVALIGLVAILARPFWGLIFFVGLLYVRPEESIKPLAGMHFTLAIALVTLVGLWFQIFLNRGQAVRTPLNGMIIGFGCVAILSSLSHGETTAAVLDFSRLIVLILLVLNLVRTPERYQALVTAMLVFTGYLASYSVYLFYTGQVVMDEGVLRSKGTGIFSDPNDLAATFVAGLALAIVRVLQTRGAIRAVPAGLACLLVYAIFLTSSRGGMLGLMAVMGGFFFTFQKRKWVGVVLAAAAVLLLLMGSHGRMTNFDSQESSANSRFVFWDNGIKQMISHPLLGIGYQKFPDINGGFVAHNSFVTCFAELGLPGYFFWMGCIYYGFRCRSGENAPMKAVSEPPGLLSKDLLGVRLAVIGYLTACFWITRTYSPVMYLLFTLPICQQVAETGLSDAFSRTSAERLQDWGRIALICVGSIFLISLMVMRLK